ncbi:MAG: hypothetical protein Q8L81_16325 [Bacteroidota bacterium]|nr:hypothetical protein [Bacteroidota bacterium]
MADNEKSFNKLPSKQALLTLGSDTCGDIITLRSGEEIIAKVKEITSELVKYKRCDHLNGPLYSVAKPTILKIKYTNGSEDVFDDAKVVTHNETVTPEKPIPDTTLHPAAILSLILSILSFFLFFAFIIFLTIAFSWGGSMLLFLLSIAVLLLLIGILVISINSAKKAIKQIKAQPEKYVGENMASTAKVISWIILIAYLVGVALLLYAFTLYF